MASLTGGSELNELLHGRELLGVARPRLAPPVVARVLLAGVLGVEVVVGVVGASHPNVPNVLRFGDRGSVLLSGIFTTGETGDCVTFGNPGPPKNSLNKASFALGLRASL